MRGLKSGAVAALVAAALAGACSAAAAASSVTLSVRLSVRALRQQVVSGHEIRLSGSVTNAAAGTTVQLYESPYPYRVPALIRTTITSADGSFSFTVSPDRNTRYRVTAVGTAGQAQVQVGVIGKVLT